MQIKYRLTSGLTKITDEQIDFLSGVALVDVPGPSPSSLNPLNKCTNNKYADELVYKIIIFGTSAISLPIIPVFVTTVCTVCTVVLVN
jgi:hypothetical protein